MTVERIVGNTTTMIGETPMTREMTIEAMLKEAVESREEDAVSVEEVEELLEAAEAVVDKAETRTNTQAISSTTMAMNLASQTIMTTEEI
jgi:hypothetical protein